MCNRSPPCEFGRHQLRSLLKACLPVQVASGPPPSPRTRMRMREPAGFVEPSPDRKVRWIHKNRRKLAANRKQRPSSLKRVAELRLFALGFWSSFSCAVAHKRCCWFVCSQLAQTHYTTTRPIECLVSSLVCSLLSFLANYLSARCADERTTTTTTRANFQKTN